MDEDMVSILCGIEILLGIYGKINGRVYDKINGGGSIGSVYKRPTIYKLNQEPNATGNILLNLNSMRWLVVLAFCVLLTV